MKIEVLDEKENPLLDRKEIVAKIIHDDSTPGRDVVRSKAIAKLKAKKDTLILDSIKTRFGARESIAHMRIYRSKGRVLEIESEHVLRKNSLISQEEKKKEEVKEKPAKKEKAEEAKKEKKEEKKPKKGEKKGEVKESPAKEEKVEGKEKEKSKAEEKKPKKGETEKGEKIKEEKKTPSKEDVTKEG
ncbi:MAG: hypothetical protein ACE5HY_01705 [Candidatus Hydrothermarchaeales archaeon]